MIKAGQYLAWSHVLYCQILDTVVLKLCVLGQLAHARTHTYKNSTTQCLNIPQDMVYTFLYFPNDIIQIMILDCLSDFLYCTSNFLKLVLRYKLQLWAYFPFAYILP